MNGTTRRTLAHLGTHAILSLSLFVAAAVARSEAANDADASYSEAISKRADKIVATLEIADAAQRTRVHDLLVTQYQRLSEIHDALKSKIEQTKQPTVTDPTIAKAWIKVAEDEARSNLVAAHRRFVARLATELSPAQIDKVKDGLTYGVVPITYKRYLELLPRLSDEQKREILADLLEAREYAMDAGTSEEKHAVFAKYKGRINNYLSAAGYNMKQAEKDLAEREKKASVKEKP